MSKRTKDVLLRHMLDHSQEAIGFAQGKTRQDLDSDRLLALALTRLLEVVGEAAARVSQGDRDANPQIPWGQIVGLRNRLIHGYDSVDLDVLWQIIVADLPPLVSDLRTILAETGP